ncbi:DUF3768 domain-containing protein [Sphingomonas sp. Tas61C01]|uniref:DUF3768 domain-containing protein n=1 Tax=Sphingomonas sp. Tas61C01 TaxID=3458297 RepID=UPI00403EF393
MPVSEERGYAENQARVAELKARATQIRRLNDEFRKGRVGGMVVITPGIRAFPPERLAKALQEVQAFTSFNESNDPYGEHDFGSIEVGHHRVFWKIDCYDKTLEFGSPNPTDPDVTRRVLTIMLAEEY